MNLIHNKFICVACARADGFYKTTLTPSRILAKCQECGERRLIAQVWQWEGKKRSADTLETLFLEVGEWAVATFTQATPESWCKHLQKEVSELAAKPSDLEEIADCMILLAGLVHKQSYTPEDLRQAIREKLEINKKRVWGQPDKDGVVEHVREEQP